jgi:triacylglycerol esterase/lipase EstA (alpha/beta hydrolase family)
MWSVLFTELGDQMRTLSARTAFAAIAGLLLGGLVAPPASAATAPSSGFNDWSCRPSAAHPDPVVMLHGLGANGDANYAGYLGPYVADLGYCVFAPTYGRVSPDLPVGGLASIAESAPEIKAYIDEVLGATGASRIDLVGHSEGGFQALYGPKVLGYADQVDTVVAMAPPTRGTDLSGLVTLGNLLGLSEPLRQAVRAFGCAACDDLLVDGAAVETLDDGPITQAGVDYTIVASRTDVVVTPYDTAFVAEPGVDNILVQDVCPFDPVGHVGLAFDSGVAQMVTNALDPASAQPVRCGAGPPF